MLCIEFVFLLHLSLIRSHRVFVCVCQNSYINVLSYSWHSPFTLDCVNKRSSEPIAWTECAIIQNICSFGLLMKCMNQTKFSDHISRQCPLNRWYIWLHSYYLYWAKINKIEFQSRRNVIIFFSLAKVVMWSEIWLWLCTLVCVCVCVILWQLQKNWLYYF